MEPLFLQIPQSALIIFLSKKDDYHPTWLHRKIKTSETIPLAFFTQQNSPEFHQGCCMYLYLIPFYCWVVVYSMGVPICLIINLFKNFWITSSLWPLWIEFLLIKKKKEKKEKEKLSCEKYLQVQMQNSIYIRSLLIQYYLLDHHFSGYFILDFNTSLRYIRDCF